MEEEPQGVGFLVPIKFSDTPDSKDGHESGYDIWYDSNTTPDF